MTSELPNSALMIELAHPARFRHIVVVIICASFIALLVWLSPEFGNDPDGLSMQGLVVMGALALFPLMRSLHALFARPHFRANNEEIELRHWECGGWCWLIPFRYIRVDRLRWDEILGVSQKRTTYNGIVVEEYAIIEFTDRKPIEIHRGVFGISVDAVANLIQNGIAGKILRDVLPSDRARPYAQRLRQQFVATLGLRYSPSFFRLAGLVIGPPIGFAGWQWLFAHIGERPKLDMAIALGACGAIGWLIFAIDETVRCCRFRGKNFWFRADGLAAGPDEFSATVYAWHEIVGARRRVTQLLDQWDRPKEPKLDGMDVLLRDGRSLWIPEKYSDRLDDLCAILSPNEGEANLHDDRDALC